MTQIVCLRTYLVQCDLVPGSFLVQKLGGAAGFNWEEIGMDKKLETKGTTLCPLMEPFNDPFH